MPAAGTDAATMKRLMENRSSYSYYGIESGQSSPPSSLQLLFSKQLAKESFPMQEKITREPIVLGFLVFNLLNSGVRELIEEGPRVGQENRRMSCHQELRALLLELMDSGQQCQLAGRRKGGFRLVQKIKPVGAEPVLNESQEGLAMRLLMERFAAVRPDERRASPRLTIEVLNLRCHIEKTLCTEEVSRVGFANSTDHA